MQRLPYGEKLHFSVCACSKWRARIALMLLFVHCASCRQWPFAPAEPNLASRVVFNLPHSGQAVTGIPSVRAVSAFDSLILRVQDKKNTFRFAHKIQPAENTVVFDINVLAGEVAFDAELLSNTGTRLYAGSVQRKLDANDFAATVPLLPQTAVMLVEPDSLVAECNREEGNLTIRNIGSTDLRWFVADVAPLNASCLSASCLEFFPDNGNVRPGSSQSVSVFSCQAAPGDRFRVRLGSNTGFVELSVLTIVRLPDLVVTELAATGSPRVNQNQSVELPIRVQVENRGFAPAGTFKLAAEFSRPDGIFLVVPFTVPGQESSWFPFSTQPLASGASLEFSGILTFPSSVRSVTVSIRVIVDSCAGEELQPAYCRVLEFDENNNISASISVSLP